MRYHLGGLSDLERGQERIVCRGSAPSQRHHNCKLPPTSPAHAIQSPPSRLLRAVQGREKQHFPTNPRPHPSPGRDRADPGAEIRRCPHHPGRAVCVLTPIAPRRVWECGSALQIPWDGAPRGCTCQADGWDTLEVLLSPRVCATLCHQLSGAGGQPGTGSPSCSGISGWFSIRHHQWVRPLTCLSFPTHNGAAALGTRFAEKPQRVIINIAPAPVTDWVTACPGA